MRRYANTSYLYDAAGELIDTTGRDGQQHAHLLLPEWPDVTRCQTLWATRRSTLMTASGTRLKSGLRTPSRLLRPTQLVGHV